MIYEVTLILDHNKQILDLVDKNYNNFFVHDFRPVYYTKWWKSTVKNNSTFEFENLEVRNMQMDIQTDYEGLKQVTKNNHHLFVFQSDKKTPDNFEIHQLFCAEKYEILKQNKLKHWFLASYEETIIGSFDKEFIEGIKSDIRYSKMIRY